MKNCSRRWNGAAATHGMWPMPAVQMLLLLLLFVVVIILTMVHPVCSYPVILSLNESEEKARCLQFSIPEDDDAHVVTMVLPDQEQMPENYNADEVELWYVEQLYKMTKLKKELQMLPRGIPDNPPEQVAQAMSRFLQHNGGNTAPIEITVSVQSYEEQVAQHEYRPKYFIPLVLNHLRKHHASNAAENYEGVRICFHSTDEMSHLLHVVFDTVLVSEEVSDLDVKPQEPGFAKDKHLTPLETSLDQSISAARQVLKEYRFMEQREKRMRQTADGIHARVHYFSYISVAILFGVTFIQVKYLKRYFKKKKLM